MSTSLHYSITPKDKTLPDELKKVIEDKFDFPYAITTNDFDYFRGLSDAGIKGADMVIEIAMKNYGMILDIKC